MHSAHQLEPLPVHLATREEVPLAVEYSKAVTVDLGLGGDS